MAERQRTNSDNGSDRLAASDFSVGERPGTDPASTVALHVCPSCSSELVYPIDWAPADRERWSVDLRCPDCEWSGSGVYAQDVVDRFDDELDLGTTKVLHDLELLVRANMEEEVDRFVEALQADWILPEDF
jgi:hypothetical protein